MKKLKTVNTGREREREGERERERDNPPRKGACFVDTCFLLSNLCYPVLLMADQKFLIFHSFSLFFVF